MTKNEIIKVLSDQINAHELSIPFSKLIMKDELIASCFKSEARVLREAAELLKAIPEWISVNDRLPEANERVLATDGEYIGEAYMQANTEFMRDFGVYAATWILIYGTNVTHWMPLPEPPKKEEEPK